MITNYIPNTCRYDVNNLKKVVHIFSSSSNKIHIDNGEAYVTTGITDFQTIYATSVEFAESTSYDDRFKFEKTVAVTCDGFLKLDSLNEKYYLVLEDENHTMWLVNADFPSFVTYTYTLADGTDETVFTFNVLSNFPTLKLNAKINNAYECKGYSLANVKELKMNLKENVTIDYKNHILYDSANKPYYIVKFNEGTLKMEETYDGFNVTTNIEFNINFDDYKASWHYNLLEYQDNKYVAVTDHLAAGFEMGLIPSYNAQGSSQKGQGDIVTITLVGTSQRGSEWAEEWTEATLIPDYIWLLSNEWICETPPTPPEYRWVVVSGGYECSGTTKMTQEKEQVSYDSGSTWSDVSPLTTRAVLPVIEYNSEDCGYVPPTPAFDGKFKLTLNNSSTVSAECNSSSAIIRSEISAYTSTLVSAIVGNCVTRIGNTAFGWCSRLTSITIGSGVISIGGQAFDSCTSLTSIDIPSGVTTIDDLAFRNCSGLTSITVNAATPPTLGSNVFYNNNAPIYVPCASVDTYKAASGWSTYASRIQGIPPCGQPTFDGKYQLTLNNSNIVTAACDSTSSVTSGEVATQYSGSVVSAVIGDCVTSIGKGAFSWCTGLTSVTIPDSVTSIGYSAFIVCSGLTSVTIPNSVTSIGSAAFQSCKSLTGITIPNGIITISGNTFKGCISFTSIGLVGSGASVEIPNSVTGIDYYAFLGCYNLTSVTIPNSVTWIGHSAFESCTGLTSITIPNSVTSIGREAFAHCSSLTSITLSDGVRNIGDDAFFLCSGLTSITCFATTPPTLGDTVFEFTNNCPIYVPSESVEAYKKAFRWSYYKTRIQGIP